MQLTLDINFDHGKENSHESNAHYQANKQHFNNQCAIVCDLLKSGYTLTSFNAVEHGIGDLRARIRDLIKMGIPIEKEFVMDAEGKKTRFKKYSIKK